MKKYLLSLIGVMAMTANAQNIEFYTPSVVRVVKAPQNGHTADKKSLVVTAAPEKVAVNVDDKGNTTVYKSKALTVTVDKQSQKVTFAKNDGTLLLAEGDYAFTPIADGIDKGKYKVKQCFALEADEPIYGLGMMQSGKMNLRGEHRNMQQSNLEDYTHFFQSIKGYGIFWDNYSPTSINDNATLELESQVGETVDYYFMYGNDADGVIAQMRHLSGKVPMLPLWTYGFHQSRERYTSQDELLEVVRRYRETGVPLDGIIQDWQYWGDNYHWNAMEFLNPTFSNAQAMIDEVHQRNAHITISIWQSFGTQTKQFKELTDKGLMFHFNTYPAQSKCYDIYSSEAHDIYWRYLSHLHKMGIDAWWMDSTDPDHNDYKDSDLDETCAMGSWRSVRNVFSLMGVGGVYDRQRACDFVKRPFILTRSFFAGQQRYGANTWSGDVVSTWETLRNQVPLCLNASLCAYPHVNTDIGGFFAGAYNVGDVPGYKNPQYQELYVRWMQFGLFNPMMRSHGTNIVRELYFYGKPGEPVYDALLSAVKMRYRLLPYIYSMSHQVSKNDDSFMRALMMDFKNDKNVWNNGKEFMFGHNLLVCPVVDALYTPEEINTDANALQAVNWTENKKYSVYLPEYTIASKGKATKGKWYDYWTNSLHDGGQTVSADAPLQRSPLYVKQGSIVPFGQDLQYCNEKAWDNITLCVYPGDNAEFTLYEDEGDNFNYQNGAYTEIPMTWNDKARTLTIAARRGSFKGMLAKRTFKVQLPDGTSKSVTYTGKKVSVKM